MQYQRKEKAQIGLRLQEARLRAHLTVQEAADSAKVQALAVEKWEKGVSLPSLLELRPLLALYGVMACQVLFDVNPIELTPEEAAELTREAGRFSPALRSKIDFLLAVLARGKEPIWKVD